MVNNIIELDQVRTVIKNPKKKTEFSVLKDISYNIQKGRVLGIVGESGCGKSMLANTIINLLPKNGEIKEGSIKLYTDDTVTELQKLEQYGKKFRSLRADKIAMIFQDPLTALNPVYSIGSQITEALTEHYKVSKADARAKAVDLMNRLGIPQADKRFDDYPHQFSGGQRQRIVIAIAMICDPEVLIADEPTTALDVTIQAQILDLLSDLKRERETSIILITHDLGVVAQMADDVIVMYAGEIVEYAPVEAIFSNPKHPYTRSLMKSIPDGDLDKRLYVIQGMVPPIATLPEKGCRFANRIPWIAEDAHETDPQLHQISDSHFVRCTCYQNFDFQDFDDRLDLPEKTFGETVLSVEHVNKVYKPKRRLFKADSIGVKALDDVTFELKKGMTIGIVGESGCGKSTLAKSLMKLHDITSGEIKVEHHGEFRNIFDLKGEDDLHFRKKIQMVFQDPYSSFNPSKIIYDSIDEALTVHKMGNKSERLEVMKHALSLVNLPEEYLYRYPHEFSGGQRQRLAIARALCLSPEILILDEPVSALDLSVQAQVLNYLIEIQRAKNLSYLFISHDLGVVKYLCDFIYVIHKGRFVEIGTREDIFNNPQHIYTKRLLAAIPEINVADREALKARRETAEVEYQNRYSEFYDGDGRVKDLVQISETHWVAK
ncbi:peptide/nickel transport system ATP-binding protein [Streptococcus rupicaprae]|uniref:Peptide/nickel transport system ATP-binding protein n=1 Tax=Streptococcus rupicaprae TaxID=759619 RepID=A0ABV2FGF7_9STRE